MPSKSSKQIRNEFFEFFEEKNHLIVDSAPVVPQSDPTLLFTNAGMNQFKPIFIGDEAGYKQGDKTWTRVANTQRCIRVSGKHNDLDEVGHDTYHHTLFEMLGNWSFGDYFKEEAIEWAWELLVDRWGLEPDRLYATIFEGDEKDGTPRDEEAANFWKTKTGIAEDHILACGKKDNFWEMGETGPCGPCSEVHIDLRSDEERKKSPGADLVNKDDPRVMEIWNLVFIQFDRQSDGSLKKLPAQHVDTGMGFERICAVLQGKTSNYDSDVFQPLIKEISTLSGMKYGDKKETDIAIRVIADHIRAVSFAIADGASPSNEGRGYVIRRILRRAMIYGWNHLGLEKPFLSSLVPVLGKQFEDLFPEVISQIEFIENVIRSEEKSFLKTLGEGLQRFNSIIENSSSISGDDAFLLHDTYGFSIDITLLLAKEKGIQVDEARFEELMQEQKQRARSAGKFTGSGKTDSLDVVNGADEDDFQNFEFVGYKQLEADVRIIGVKRGEKESFVYLNKSPFYAESGGQVADTGTLKKGDAVIKVKDVQKTAKGFAHRVDSVPGDVSGSWNARVDREKRTEIEKHHTATHLMHAALRETLGDHVAQKGSLVEPFRLRFDFSHFEGVTSDELDRIEHRVNEKIQENIPLKVDMMSIEEAKKTGAMMLFGEKYGETVRVVTFDPDFSMELCGGTHVRQTGEIGYFRFLSESSAAAGVRRIEAVVGNRADNLLREEKQQLAQIYSVLGNRNAIEEIEKLQQENKNLEKELQKLQQKEAAGVLDDILSAGTEIDGVKLFSGTVPGGDMDTLKQLGYESLKREPKSAVTVLAAADREEGKVVIMASVTDDLIKDGLKAGSIVSKLGKIVGGGGGGQPNLATAGGRFPDKIDEAFKAAVELVKELKS